MDRDEKILRLALTVLQDLKPTRRGGPVLKISNMSGLKIECPDIFLDYCERVAGEIKKPIVPVQSKDVSSVGSTRFSMKVKSLDVSHQPAAHYSKGVKNDEVVEWEITVEFTKESRLSQDKKQAFIANVKKLM